MNTSLKTQTAKLSGSFFNYLYGNNQTVPIVGKGATRMLHSDRHAYEVISVSEDGKSCQIQRYNPVRIDKLGMSDMQEYSYEELTDEILTLRWRNNAWRIVSNQIVFTDEFIASCPNGIYPSMFLTPEQKFKVYEHDIYPKNIVEGITKSVKKFYKINILFGSKIEYYDFSF
jgi:hypothetical protein